MLEGATTTMRPWLIMLGPGLALIGLQAVQAQVVIDVTKITCQQFLENRVTDTTTLSVWLNGYVNGARGKTLINPLSSGRIDLVHYCEDHADAVVLDAARKVFGTDK
jgi:acid stress chaperone HdeB